AERSASSNEVSFSRCLPTPLVKNISRGTNPTTSRAFSCGNRMVNTPPSTVNEWTRALAVAAAIIGWIPDSAMSTAHAPCAAHAHAAACAAAAPPPSVAATLQNNGQACSVLTEQTGTAMTAHLMSIAVDVAQFVVAAVQTGAGA